MNPQPTFEQSMTELETILRELEDGQSTLDTSLANYERGVQLLRICHSKLQAAEQKIEQLTGTDADGKPILTPFDHVATAKS
jgi:exodeoxyribonuclease VII small subunit